MPCGERRTLEDSPQQIDGVTEPFGAFGPRAEGNLEHLRASLENMLGGGGHQIVLRRNVVEPGPLVVSPLVFGRGDASILMRLPYQKPKRGGSGDGEGGGFGADRYAVLEDLQRIGVGSRKERPARDAAYCSRARRLQSAG